MVNVSETLEEIMKGTKLLRTCGFGLNLGIGLALLTALLLSGCAAYRINYSLNEREIVPAQKPCSLSVAVAILNDQRDQNERVKEAQKAISDDNVGDYTYDKDFKGGIDESISEMLASHLEYSRSFRRIGLLEYNAAALSRPVMDSLGARGVEAVLTGSIRHFSGFYERRRANEVLLGLGLGVGCAVAATLLTMEEKTYQYCGPGGQSGLTYVEINPAAGTLAGTAGAILGGLLESSGKRDFSRHTQLSVNLLSTVTGDTLWSETVEVIQREHNSMPGLNGSKKKQELAVSSLREAVNKIVESLSKTQIQLPDNTHPAIDPTQQARTEQ